MEEKWSCEWTKAQWEKNAGTLEFAKKWEEHLIASSMGVCNTGGSGQRCKYKVASLESRRFMHCWRRADRGSNA